MLPEGVTIAEAHERFVAGFDQFVTDTLGSQWEWISGSCDHFAVSPRSGVIKSPEVRAAEFDALLAELHEAQDAAPPRVLTHEKDGNLGWWHVDGVRHSAIVKASSAAEAVKRADEADAVHSWESPDTDWIGEELPNVVRC